MLDFARIKEIKLTDVCAKYGISLRFGPEWASAKCPLPTHKDGDKDRTFQVNLKQNYWKCWSASCNEKAGKKGGDCINFVAVMERSSQLDAANKLAAWFHLDNQKPAPHIEKRAPEKAPKTNPQRDSKDHNGPAIAVKSGFLHDTGLWLDELLGNVVEDDVIRKSVKKAVMDRIHQSFVNGKKAAQGVPV